MTDDVSPGHADDEDSPPTAVLATTDRPIPIEVREIADDRVPDGMACLATYLDSHLVARCVVPPEAIVYFTKHGVFAEPRQLVLAAREEDPGLQCELYAIVPMPDELMHEGDDAAEPWAASVPSSGYERAVAEMSETPGARQLAAVLLGSIVRFERDRKHPDSLPREAVDVLAKIVSGSVVEAVDKALEDLLGP